MLLNQLQQDLYSSLKKKEELRTSVLRFLISAINYKKIELQRELTDEDVYYVIRKLVKQHGESISMFKKGNRPDLVDKEEKELIILKDYLPKEASEEEVETVIKKVVEDFKKQGVDVKSQMGRVIGAAVKELKGKADGGRIAEIVKEMTNS